MQREACRGCPLQQECTIRPPQTPRGSRPRVFTKCAYYTCTKGLENAKKALAQNEKPITFLDASGSTRTGNQFGTPEKPTHVPTSHIKRAVSQSGEIYAIDHHNRGVKTAVTINTEEN